VTVTVTVPVPVAVAAPATVAVARPAGNNRAMHACKISAVAVAVAVAFAAVVTVSPAAAQNPPAPPKLPTDLATSQDCLELALQAGDDPTLTRAERIAALDKALLESLSRTDLCGGAGLGVGAGDGEAIGGGGGGVAGAGGGGGDGGGDGDAGAPLESLPASGVQGDLPETVETAAVDPSPDTTAKPDATDNTQPGAPANVPGVPSPSDGEVPDDIPPSANDDIIARQLREAALAETDPATRAKLWNEYRRYNNLPVKEVPDDGGDGEAGDGDVADTADATDAGTN